MQKKQCYYKQEILTLQQLQKNCERITEDLRMADCSKAQNIANMFASYKKNNNIA